jgi:CheY-like chemotaxis protein
MITLCKDNIINQKVFQKLLSKLGVSADVASNGQEAMDMARVKDYPLIFMDLEVRLY